jgi:hypothetical protein
MTLFNGVVIGDVALLINIVATFASLTQGAATWLLLPLPFPFSLSLQNFHIVIVKKHCCGLLFPFIDNFKTCTSI